MQLQSNICTFIFTFWFSSNILNKFFTLCLLLGAFLDGVFFLMFLLLQDTGNERVLEMAGAVQ
jgi:hypothetical protein